MDISVVFFFFKQKTAYEIKECDWNSDVCSFRSLRGNQSSCPYLALHRLNKLFRIPTYSILEHQLDVFDIADVGGRIALHQHNIGLLARRQRPDAVTFTQKLRAIQRCDEIGR